MRCIAVPRDTARRAAQHHNVSGVNTSCLFNVFDQRGASATQRDTSGVNIPLFTAVTVLGLSQTEKNTSGW